jgi:hypothetical protein
MTSEEDKEKLQQQMAVARDSLAATVGEIKDTVELEVDTVKETVSNVMNFRGEFQKEPLVWSLGALSAGFALGYTVGYAHKKTRGKKHSEITAFADNMVDQLSAMGNGMVLPVLDAKIRELFGINFSAMVTELGDSKKKRSSSKKRSTSTKAIAGGRGKKRSGRAKRAHRDK